MCGIAGLFSAQPLPEETGDDLGAMLRLIHHRGPDGHGDFTDRAAGVAMGHTRLSIIDLHTGSQPIYSRDDRYVITINGEFYDYKRLRSQAMADGDRFTT